MALYPKRIHGGDQLAAIALCAGIGGLELGLHIAEPNYRTICFVEREVSTAATLVARMEDQALDRAPIWDDLKSFDGHRWNRKANLVTAGYPCQPFSSSGRRKGKDDPRHLWPDVKRIALEVDTEWLFCENVEGHLDMGLSEVFKDLSKMGFTTKAGLFSALEVGASHLRRRVFFLAHANHFPLRQPRGSTIQPSRNSMEKQSRADRVSNKLGPSGAQLVDANNASSDVWSENGEPETLPIFAPAPFEFAKWEQIQERGLDLQPELFGLDNGVANRLERTHAAGNGVVSLVAAYAWRTLRAAFD